MEHWIQNKFFLEGLPSETKALDIKGLFDWLCQQQSIARVVDIIGIKTESFQTVPSCAGFPDMCSPDSGARE